MIALADNCLVFQLETGESVPYSVEMVSVEMGGENAKSFEPEFVEHAARAVFHYFKHELGRQSVSVGEFTELLEKVLIDFKGRVAKASVATPGVCESDLQILVYESGDGCELFFFKRLRAQLRHNLQSNPRLVRFHGLRAAVKQLTGARRWCLRCDLLKEQIVCFLRECVSTEPAKHDFSLLVD
jgi:hypothetical protein